LRIGGNIMAEKCAVCGEVLTVYGWTNEYKVSHYVCVKCSDEKGETVTYELPTDARMVSSLKILEERAKYLEEHCPELKRGFYNGEE